jgi:hypothetical protein
MRPSVAASTPSQKGWPPAFASTLLCSAACRSTVFSVAGIRPAGGTWRLGWNCRALLYLAALGISGERVMAPREKVGCRRARQAAYAAANGAGQDLGWPPGSRRGDAEL